jgi:hypothetical protein
MDAAVNASQDVVMVEVQATVFAGQENVELRAPINASQVKMEVAIRAGQKEMSITIRACQGKLKAM